MDGIESKRIKWDEVGKKLYQTGTDRGVLYPQEVNGTYPAGVAWDGLIGIDESPTGGEPNPLYANNKKYLELMANEEFEATIEAYTYPDEFEACDGSAEIVTGVFARQQKRQPFGFSYRTIIGNDIEDTDYGYKIHIVYNAKASPTSKTYQTINETPEAITFSWPITTTPVEVAGHRPTAKIELDSTKIDIKVIEKIEDILYGTADEGARLPSPDEIIEIYESTIQEP